MSISASKLGALYDYLDGHNFKAGLKLANSLLEKNSKSDLVKSLKAYALERTGKTDEAHQICSEILSHHPLDEDCLHPLKLVLRNLHRLQDITRIYEAAHAARPNHEGTALDLFASYVRDGNLIKQQQLAMRLLKLSGGKEQYQWWVILSIMLQACNALPPPSVSDSLASSPTSASSPGALDPGKLLQLAESMASRLVARFGKLESLEGLLVYLDLLLARGQPREALALVTGPVGGGVLRLAEERALLHADLAAACGEMQEAAGVLRAQLASNPEDWAALTGYLDCLLPQSTAAANPPSSCTDSQRQQQQQQQQQPGMLTRHCASSSLLWFTGGLAARMQAGSPGASSQHPQQQQLPDGNHKVESSSEHRPENIEAALAEANSTIEGMLSAVGGQQQPQGQGRQVTMRGPHLAKVELAWRVAKLSACTDPSIAPAKWQLLAEAIMGYVQFAGQMYSCAADLRPYLPHVAGNARTWLLQQLHEVARFPTAAQGSNSDHLVAGREPALRKRISALQVMEGLGSPVFGSEEQAVQHALQLMQLYVDAQQLYKGLDERERAPADELPPLAASALVSAAIIAPSDTTANSHLLHALLMLESAAATRKWSAPIRLALVALHTLLASPGGARANMEWLSIKHVQLDTLGGHFLLPALRAYPSEPSKAAAPGAASGAGAEPKRPSTKLLASMCAFFSDHRKDAGETLFTAYSSGTYSKVLEFSAFKERLEASHTHLLARAEAVLDSLQASLAATPQLSAASVCTLVADTWDALGFKDAAHATRTAGTAQQSAVQELPLTLPTPPLQHTRFDEDLSTRPVWYPPVAAPVHLAPVCWWEQRGVGGALQGSGLGWWAATASAESKDPQAAAWRQGSHAAACAQLHLPQLLTASLLCLAHAHEAPASATPTHHLARARAAAAAMASLQSSGGETDPQQQQQQQQQQGQEQQLQQCLEQWSRTVSGPEWASLPCSQQLQRLEVTLGAAMVAACEAVLVANRLLDPKQAAHTEPSPVLQAHIELAQAALSAACSKLCAMLAPQPQSNGATAEAGLAADGSGAMVLPGAPLALAAALVHRSLAWLPVFLQAWSDSLVHLQARAKKAKSSPQGLEARSSALSAALSQLTQAHQHAQQQLEESLHFVRQWQQGHQESLHEKSRCGDMQQLWAWQHSQAYEAGCVLRALAEEQGTLVQGLIDMCSKGRKQAKK